MATHHLGTEFSDTVEALLGALPVSQIASSPIACCALRDDVGLVVENEEWRGFDTLGVRVDDRIVGFLRRTDVQGQGTVNDYMIVDPPWPMLRPSEALTTAIRGLSSAETALIKENGRFTGIVTRSDLLRLPVRVLCFAFVAHVEMVLAKAIAAYCHHDEAKWLRLLSSGRRAMIEERRRALQKHGMDPSPVELLELCDKRVAAQGLFQLPPAFDKDLREIELRLRNPVAHASDFLGSGKDVETLLRCLRAAYHWSQVLRKRYRVSIGGFTDLEGIGRSLFGEEYEAERESWG